MNRIVVKNFATLTKYPKLLLHNQIRGYQCDGRVYGFNALAWKNKREASKGLALIIFRFLALANMANICLHVQ